jgi:hypothetical protein
MRGEKVSQTVMREAVGTHHDGREEDAGREELDADVGEGLRGKRCGQHLLRAGRVAEMTPIKRTSSCRGQPVRAKVSGDTMSRATADSERRAHQSIRDDWEVESSVVSPCSASGRRAIAAAHRRWSGRGGTA